MPIRKKIGQIFRHISGMPSVDTASPQSLLNSPHQQHPLLQLNRRANPDHNKDIPELVLYGRSSCPYCVRVDSDRRTRSRIKLPDEILASDRVAFRFRNRTGSTQVPCLFIDGEPMFESLDIIAWLRANLT